MAIKVTEKTKELQNRINVLEYDNEKLTHQIEKIEREIKNKIHNFSTLAQDDK